tara:strand:+ start:369 stop:728 length:360 start_codon:yes stop_codon:yes gene_type:complete
MDINRIPTPTPPTDEELVEMRKQQEKERQKRLLTYDNTIVLAKLHYYKGTIAVASTDSVTHKQFSDVVTGWNSVVMVGTERQMCADDTIDNITGTYHLNLTDKMLKAYKENNNQLIIIK